MDRISGHLTGSGTSQMNALISSQQENVDLEAQVSLAPTPSMEKFTDAFFEAEINGDIKYANLLRILIIRGTDHFEKVFVHGTCPYWLTSLMKSALFNSIPAHIRLLTVPTTTSVTATWWGEWPDLCDNDVMTLCPDPQAFLDKWRPIFETEANQLEALGKIEYIVGKLFRDDAFCFVEMCDRAIYDEYAITHFSTAARFGYFPAFEALKNMYLERRGFQPLNFIHSYLAEAILQATSPGRSELPADTGNEFANTFLFNLFKSPPDPRAPLLLYLMYQSNDAQKADTYLCDAAFFDNNLDARFQYGHDLLLECYGDDTEPSLENEYKKEFYESFLIEVADEGSQQAKVFLEKLYIGGGGKFAFKYFYERDQNGDAQAPYGLAMLYAKGLSGVEQDLKKANTYFIKSADNGSPDALFMCAQNCLEQGVSLENCAETSEAGRYLLKAADKGHPRANYLVGIHYLGKVGKSTSNWTMSYNKAEKYITFAHHTGEAAATYMLGVMHELGIVGEIDFHKRQLQALRLFKQAASRKNSDALYKLGDLFFTGLTIGNNEITSQDTNKSNRYYKMAAELGHPSAAILQ